MKSIFFAKLQKCTYIYNPLQILSEKKTCGIGFILYYTNYDNRSRPQKAHYRVLFQKEVHRIF